MPDGVPLDGNGVLGWEEMLKVSVETVPVGGVYIPLVALRTGIDVDSDKGAVPSGDSVVDDVVLYVPLLLSRPLLKVLVEGLELGPPEA